MSEYQVRPASLTDLSQIHEIFNYYVVNTVSSFYYNPLLFSTIESKYETARKCGLPYLVATDPVPGPDGSSIVLGYVYALPYRSPLLAYASSVEISVYVRSSHLHRGIGDKLLNALLGRLKAATHHATEPGHEDRSRTAKVRNVFAVMAHDVNGPDREAGERLQGWYGTFGFEVVGRMKNAGWKHDRWIDIVYTQLDLDGWHDMESKPSVVAAIGGM